MKPSYFIFLSVALAAGSLTGTTFADVIYFQNKCVDLPNANTTNGNRLQLWDCNGTNAQRWLFMSDGTIRSGVNTNKCIDLPGWNTADGTPIQIYDCNGGSNQQWTAINNTIQGFGGECIDDPGAVTTDGTKLQYWGCNGWVNQDFSVAMSPDILARWQSFGGPSGFLGSPTTNEQPWGNGTITYFQNGYIAAFNGTDTVVEIGGDELVFQIAHIDSGSMHLMEPLTLSVFSDGGYQLSGLFYDNSWPLPVTVSFALLWKAADGTPFAFTHTSGDLWFGSPWENGENLWVSSGTNAALAQDWNNFINGWSYSWQASDSVDVSGIISGLAKGIGAGAAIVKVL
jgi:hypothetical protein